MVERAFDHENRMLPVKAHKFLDVNKIQLVGGAVCLDFVNTTGARASGQPRERLCEYDDVVTWSRRAGIFASLRKSRHSRASAPDAAQSQEALQRVHDVREVLYRVFRPVADKRTPTRKDVRHLDRLSREDRLRRELVIAEHGAELKVSSGTSELDRLISTVVDSAVTLLRSDRLRRLKRCAECDWLFLDETKNQSRMWCKKVCGDRVRARRHYSARRGASRVATLRMD